MSEEREFAHAEWRQGFFDRTSREPTPSEAWYAALKWQAGRQSAGATEQEPAAWLHKQGDFLEPSLRRLDSYELSRGWTQEPLFYAAPIGDNGSKAKQQIVGYCKQGENCVCGGDFPQVRAGCYEWVSQPAESKRVELTDEDCEAIKRAASLLWVYRRIESRDTIDALRNLLSCASAKGE